MMAKEDDGHLDADQAIISVHNDNSLQDIGVTSKPLKLVRGGYTHWWARYAALKCIWTFKQAVTILLGEGIKDVEQPSQKAWHMYACLLDVM